MPIAQKPITEVSLFARSTQRGQVTKCEDLIRWGALPSTKRRLEVFGANSFFYREAHKGEIRTVPSLHGHAVVFHCLSR